MAPVAESTWYPACTAMVSSLIAVCCGIAPHLVNSQSGNGYSVCLFSPVRRASIFLILVIAYGALLNGADTTWLSYGNNNSGWRFADLSEINKSNVARLTPRWIFQ